MAEQLSDGQFSDLSFEDLSDQYETPLEITTVAARHFIAKWERSGIDLNTVLDGIDRASRERSK